MDWQSKISIRILRTEQITTMSFYFSVHVLSISKQVREKLITNTLQALKTVNHSVQTDIFLNSEYRKVTKIEKNCAYQEFSNTKRVRSADVDKMLQVTILKGTETVISLKATSFFKQRPTVIHLLLSSDITETAYISFRALVSNSSLIVKVRKDFSYPCNIIFSQTYATEPTAETKPSDRHFSVNLVVY